MSLRRVSAEQAMQQIDAYSAVIDARSEGEFALDRLPGAVNWPSLDDEQRRIIGTEYKASPFQARKHGAALVATNIARHVQTHVMPLERDWRPLVYCWRGGQRSAALASVLDQIGFHVQVLDGGYAAFRTAVREALELPPALPLVVLCGRTGTGKTRLLHALAVQGAQVLDLEALACHRGSVLGPLPDREQPSQKAFETQLWDTLRRLDPTRPVYAEGESRTIGRLRLPERLLEHLRAAPCLRLELPLPARVQLLLQDYGHFVTDTEGLCERLQALRELRGAQTVERWQAMARAGALPAVVQELLEQHYDPIYERSMARNFAGFLTAERLALADANPVTLGDLAHDLSRRPIPEARTVPGIPADRLAGLG